MMNRGRQVEIINTLCERAERNGLATIVRNGKIVYEVEQVDNTDGTVKGYTLTHYGTRTAFIQRIKGQYVLQDWDGFSNSDRDSINSFLDYFHVIGGYMKIIDEDLVYVDENGKTHGEYLTEYDATVNEDTEDTPTVVISGKNPRDAVKRWEKESQTEPFGVGDIVTVRGSYEKERFKVGKGLRLYKLKGGSVVC